MRKARAHHRVRELLGFERERVVLKHEHVREVARLDCRLPRLLGEERDLAEVLVLADVAHVGFSFAVYDRALALHDEEHLPGRVALLHAARSL